MKNATNKIILFFLFLWSYFYLHHLSTLLVLVSVEEMSTLTENT